MPNLPMLIGCGVAGMCLGKNARPEDARLTEQLCGAAAQTVRVEERLMDAVTAVSGSGPAYVFYLAEAMIAAGEAEGLTAAQARQLVVRTLFGAGKMLEDTGEDPAVLRRRVTSPGGTTAAALEVLEARGAREIWVAALRRAAERSRELGAR
jgi:pyrroline-5-carboxylate reductase